MTLPLLIDKEEGCYMCPVCGELLYVVMAAEYIAAAIAPDRGSEDEDFADIVWEGGSWGASRQVWERVFCSACHWSARNHGEIETATEGRE